MKLQKSLHLKHTELVSKWNLRQKYQKCLLGTLWKNNFFTDRVNHWEHFLELHCYCTSYHWKFLAIRVHLTYIKIVSTVLSKQIQQNNESIEINKIIGTNWVDKNQILRKESYCVLLIKRYVAKELRY